MVTELDVPATVGEGMPLTVNVLAAAGLTTIPVWLPVIEGVTVSVAVIDCVPAVLRVNPLVNVCTPLSPATKV
jgi:hypothetical protein